MNKFGAVLISFSWIFMVIVGSFFIIFAYNIISTYQENELAKQDLEFGLSLQSIFKKVGYGKGSETTSLEKVNYIFEDSKIELLCESGFPILSVNGVPKSGNSYLKNYPFFMTTIEQDQIDETYIAVEEFDFPFYVTPLMALISERNLYVFDEEIWESTFEDKFSKTSAFRTLNTRVFNFRNPDNTPNSIEIEKLYDEIDELEINSVTFVSSDTNPQEIQLPSYLSDVQGINIVINQRQESSPFGNSLLKYTTGKITYTSTSYWDSDLSNEYTFNYTDLKESMSLPTFAIFSTPESFDCGYQTIDTLITSTYTYYIDKTDILINEVNNPNFVEGKFCSNSRNQGEIISYYEKIKENLIRIRDDPHRFKNVDDLNDFITELWKSEETLELNNCIEVY